MILALVSNDTSLLLVIFSNPSIAALLLISWLPSPSELITELREVKSLTILMSLLFLLKLYISSVVMIFVFLMFKFSPTSALSFAFIRSCFRSVLISASKVALSMYLKLFIILPLIFNPHSSESSPAFHVMCFAYKLSREIKCTLV